MTAIDQSRGGIGVEVALRSLGGDPFGDGVSPTRSVGGSRLVILLSMAFHMAKKDIAGRRSATTTQRRDKEVSSHTCARKPCHISCKDMAVL